MKENAIYYSNKLRFDAEVAEKFLNGIYYQICELKKNNTRPTQYFQIRNADQLNLLFSSFSV